MDSLLSIIALLAIFGMPVFIILIIAVFYFRTQRMKYRTAVELARNGHPVPESLFAKDNVESSVRQLRVGMIYMAIGIGLTISSFTIGYEDLWGLATIPGLIGVAYLVTALVTRRSERERNNAQPQE